MWPAPELRSPRGTPRHRGTGISQPVTVKFASINGIYAVNYLSNAYQFVSAASGQSAPFITVSHPEARMLGSPDAQMLHAITELPTAYELLQSGQIMMDANYLSAYVRACAHMLSILTCLRCSPNRRQWYAPTQPFCQQYDVFNCLSKGCVCLYKQNALCASLWRACRPAAVAATLDHQPNDCSVRSNCRQPHE